MTQIIYRRDVIRESRDRWLNQYRHHKDGDIPGWIKTKTFGGIRRELAALDLDTCTPDDIDAVLGVTGWGNLICDECGKDHLALVRIGEEPDYERRWWDICGGCLAQAQTALSNAPVKP